METEKAKAILEGIQPIRPQRKETRELQEAIDLAIHALCFYEDFLRIMRSGKL